MNVSVVNILDLLDLIGEENLINLFSTFFCAKNSEIEFFLKNNAVNFAKRKMAITYLVLDAENKIIAYFSITHKALEIKDNGLSNSVKKTLNRYSQFDSNSKSYTVSAFLIAQFGKNLSYDGDEKISGNDLMDSCFDILLKIQHDAGGGVIYLECENNEKLLNFYTNTHNNFRIFGERKSQDDNCDYLQLLRLF